MTRKLIFIVSLIALWMTAGAQVSKPADPQSGPIALVGGIAHLGTGEVIENATITFARGKITGVYKDGSADLSGHTQINVSGKHLYPGLILPASTLGLVDISAVRASRDYSEVGTMNPNVRSLIAYNTDSEVIGTVRRNGVQLVQVAPQGGRIKGTSSIMMLDGWNWEDASYKVDDAVHMSWPRIMLPPRWWLGESGMRENKQYADQVKEILQFFAETKSYMSSGSKETNLKLEAMKGVLDGSKRLYIDVDGAKEIVEAVTELKKAGVKHLVINGGYDAWRVASLLKEHGVPVISGNLHRLPRRDDEPIDIVFRLPKIMHEQGLLVALNHNSYYRSRNLPFLAGSAVSRGLDKEVALQMMTLNTAKIMGIDDRTGSLETGKDANILVSDGDLFDMRGNNLAYSFIMGKEIVLDGMQEALFERFRDKYQND